MKFGRNKSSSLSPNHTSIIARVFPVSWVSKFKKKGGNSESEFAKKDQRGKLDFSTPNSSNWKQGRFYSMDDDDDDDGYWRISFEGRMSTGGVKINPVWYDSDSEFEAEDEFHFRRSDYYRNFNDMVLDVKKMKDKQRIVRKYRGKTSNDRISRKQRGKKQAEIGAKIVSKSPQKDIFAIESENLDRLNEEFWNLDISDSRNQHKNRNFDPNSINEDYELEKQRISVSDWKNLENNNRFHEIKVKTEPRSINGESRTRRVKQMNKSKAYSPRTECKIRAIEEMKKARMKLKKMNDRKVFDSYAVAKSSYNPERDFRDSMVEMIRENGIRRPEELEELLACYLTLNCDEYHDLIIKVFRQVWFELHGACLDAQIFFD